MVTARSEPTSGTELRSDVALVRFPIREYIAPWRWKWPECRATWVTRGWRDCCTMPQVAAIRPSRA